MESLALSTADCLSLSSLSDMMLSTCLSAEKSIHIAIEDLAFFYLLDTFYVLLVTHFEVCSLMYNVQGKCA